MNKVEVFIRRVDRFQQGHAVIGFPFAVAQKFGNDQAGGKAALIAYYGFFAVFPLLLLLATILGFVLHGNPRLQNDILNSALANFPIIGTQLRSATHPLTGNALALAVGVFGTIYGSVGLAQAAENAMNTVWNIPFKDWPNVVFRHARGLATLALMGLGIVLTTLLAGFASQFFHGELVRVWSIAASTAVNLGIFFAAFMLLTAEPLGWRDVALGAVLATVFWEVLQAFGGLYVTHVIQKATDVYGFFAIVIGLLSWLYLGAQLTLLAAEINVVRRYKLWPRSMTQPPFTREDKATFVRLAMMEERRPEQRVTVTFSAEADRQPLREVDTPAG